MQYNLSKGSVWMLERDLHIHYTKIAIFMMKFIIDQLD